MIGKPSPFRASYVAALLAVALLTLAGVRSIVMQAAEAGPAAAMPMCGMAGIAGPMKNGGHAPGKAPKVCEYCSAAAHAPIRGTVTPLIAPLAVHYLTWRSHRVLGPRGPPAITAKARGPPTAPLTA